MLGSLQKLLDELTEVGCQVEFKAKSDAALGGKAQSLKKAADNLAAWLQTFRPWLIEAEAVAASDFKAEMLPEVLSRLESAVAHQDGVKATLRRARQLLAAN